MLRKDRWALNVPLKLRLKVQFKTQRCNKVVARSPSLYGRMVCLRQQRQTYRLSLTTGDGGQRLHCMRMLRWHPCLHLRCNFVPEEAEVRREPLAKRLVVVVVGQVYVRPFCVHNRKVDMPEALVEG